MTDKPRRAFMASYDDEFGAKQALKDFQAMHRERSIDLIDAALIVHTAEGKAAVAIIAVASGEEDAAGDDGPADGDESAG